MSKPKLKKQIVIEAGMPAVINAAQDEDKIPTFAMNAYTGGVMNVSGWYMPVVIDISGMSLGRKNQPVLKDHDTSLIVGHATKISKTSNSVLVEGVCSGAGSAQSEIVASSKNGFPWQASVGVEVNRIIEIAENKTVNVNGEEFAGPLYVARKSKLNEVSFVALGADENTSAKVAAKAAEDLEIEMEELEMTDEERKAMEAEKAKEAKEKLEAEKAKELEAKKEEPKDSEKAIKAMRDEQMRINKINAACKNYPEVAEKAISEGMSIEAAKAAILDVIESRQSSDVNAFYINTGKDGQETNADVLTAAACLSTGAIKHGKIEKEFDEKIIDAGSKMRNLGITGLMAECCRLEGVNINASIASTTELVNAAFSTVSLPQMLGNLANKALLDAFSARPSAAALLAEKLSANDFKQHTGIKLGGLGTMEKVQNGGEIKSGTMSEEYFNYRVNTVGKLIGLTREMLVNDDLGGFTRLAENLGRSAYNTREHDFWALVLANTDDFFGSGNSNLIDDVLDIDGIAVAEQTLMEQTAIDGTPANIMGKYLVCPPSLGSTARAIYSGQKVVGGTTVIPDANVFEDVYQPVVTPYLSNTSVNASASDTGWYLFSDTVRPFGISYLNGNETPVVEEVAPQAGFLGRVWQGYYDYGTCQVEYRGGVFSSGDAS